MANTNLQIRIPETLNDKIMSLAPKSKSDFVREAIEEKINHEINRKLERQWIAAIKNGPEDIVGIDDWLRAESWGDE